MMGTPRPVQSGSDFEGSVSPTSHLIWKEEIRPMLSAGRLRTVEDSGDKAALDWVHGQAKTLNRVGSEDLDVAVLTEERYSVEGSPFERDENFRGGAFDDLPLNCQDAPPFGGLDA